MTKTYNNRSRKLLLQQINEMSGVEHEEIFKTIRENAPKCTFTENSNGVFFNMTNIPNNVIEMVEKCIIFCNENNKHLDAHDQKMQEFKMKTNELVDRRVALDNGISHINNKTFQRNIHSLVVGTNMVSKNPSTNASIKVHNTNTNTSHGTFIDSTTSTNSTTSSNFQSAASSNPNINKVILKKVTYTLYHAAVKRLSKRVPNEKRQDANLEDDIEREHHD